MIGLRTALTAAAAAILMPSVASAKSVGEKDVVSGKTRLDPSMGYVLISGEARQFGTFIRMPDEETRRLHEADRLKAFAKAQKKYPGQLANWQAQVETARQTHVAPTERPEEPMLATFTIDPIELRDVESFGPMFVYSKGATVTYLNTVKPGTWIWYGPVMLVPNGASVGMCHCMGTVRFEVKPGMITDLGSSLADLPRWQDDKDVARLLIDQENAKRVAEGKEALKTLASGNVQYGAPASLAGWPVVRAELHASPKMNNYYGLTISRVAPIPGVLAYRRDVVVDARTGQDIDSPTIVSRAKIKK